MSTLFVDTSGWYAFLVQKEETHQQIVSLLLGKAELMTSNLVFGELFTLLVARGYEAIAISFGQKLKEGKIGRICRINENDEEKAWEILNRRRGRGLSYVDAATIALMNRLKCKTMVGLDGGFREFGFQLLP